MVKLGLIEAAFRADEERRRTGTTTHRLGGEERGKVPGRCRRVGEEEAPRRRPAGERFGERPRRRDRRQRQPSALLGRLDHLRLQAVEVDTRRRRPPREHRLHRADTKFGGLLDDKVGGVFFERREQEQRAGFGSLPAQAVQRAHGAAAAIEVIDAGQPLAVTPVEQTKVGAGGHAHHLAQVVMLHRGEREGLARSEGSVDEQPQAGAARFCFARRTVHGKLACKHGTNGAAALGKADVTPQTHNAASDIVAGDWVDRWLPSRWRPFVRLGRFDRPIGIWLLLLPCWWGVALASPGWPDPWLFALFALGATVMRAAGCIVNDLADRDFDRRVARTATRPLASGEVSPGAALLMMALLSLIGLAVLLQFNRLTAWLGCASLALVVLYPFAKRVTYWPQLVLGLTFNWGALLGWTAVAGGVDWPALLLYCAGVFWTLGYDTIYAHQDKADDLMVGVKSTALRFGPATPYWLAFFYGATIVLLALAGLMAGLAGWPLAVGLLLVAGHFAWQLGCLDLDDPKDCLAKFASNRIVGLIVLATFIVGRQAG